jgi:methenyltetrahydromethanopterin cyclohydrolase
MGADDRYSVGRTDDGRWVVVFRGEVYSYCKSQRDARRVCDALNEELSQARYARRHEGR